MSKREVWLIWELSALLTLVIFVVLLYLTGQ